MPFEVRGRKVALIKISPGYKAKDKEAGASPEKDKCNGCINSGIRRKAE